MKAFFHASDFHPKCKDTIDYIGQMEMAEIANKILNEHLESLPVVYKNGEDYAWQGFQGEKCISKARLFGIEEIKKECKHEPIVSLGLVIDNNDYHYKAICKHCNAELIAEWRVK